MPVYSLQPDRLDWEVKGGCERQKYFPGNSTYANLREPSLGVDICLKKIHMLC